MRHPHSLNGCFSGIFKKWIEICLHFQKNVSQPKIKFRYSWYFFKIQVGLHLFLKNLQRVAIQPLWNGDNKPHHKKSNKTKKKLLRDLVMGHFFIHPCSFLLFFPCAYLHTGLRTHLAPIFIFHLVWPFSRQNFRKGWTTLKEKKQKMNKKTTTHKNIFLTNQMITTHQFWRTKMTIFLDNGTEFLDATFSIVVLLHNSSIMYTRWGV